MNELNSQNRHKGKTSLHILDLIQFRLIFTYKHWSMSSSNMVNGSSNNFMLKNKPHWFFHVNTIDLLLHFGQCLYFINVCVNLSHSYGLLLSWDVLKHPSFGVMIFQWRNTFDLCFRDEWMSYGNDIRASKWQYQFWVNYPFN